MNVVCHVTSVHKYNDVRILKKECVTLSKKYKVILVAPNIQSFEYEGVTIRGVDLPKNRIKRVLCLKRVYKLLRELDADVYHFHDPELMTMGLRMKKLNKKIIFDSHEDIPLDIAEKKWIPAPFRKLLSLYYKILEKYALARYDAVISVTPTIVEKLRLINKNTYQVTNYPIYKEIEDKRKWGDSICFAGLVSPNWMHTNIINSLDGLEIKYKLAGPVTENYLNFLKGLVNWKKVDYVGVMDPNQIPDFLQNSSIGIALYDYLPSFGYKTGSLGNNKIFEYMAAGIPIIATDFTLWKEIIEDQNCGICVNPNDLVGISHAILELMENKEKSKQMGDKGKVLVKEKYNWNSQEPILFEAYNSIINN